MKVAVHRLRQQYREILRREPHYEFCRDVFRDLLISMGRLIEAEELSRAAVADRSDTRSRP